MLRAVGGETRRVIPVHEDRLRTTFPSRLTDKGLQHLKRLSQLQTLDVSGTKVTDAGTDDLQRALPKVKIVR